MTYEITTPGKHDTRIVVYTEVLRSLAEARKVATRIAPLLKGTLYIERVSTKGKSTVVEVIK